MSNIYNDPEPYEASQIGQLAPSGDPRTAVNYYLRVIKALLTVLTDNETDTLLSASTTLTDAHYALYYETDAGDITQTLRDANDCPGKQYVFFRISDDANTLTIAPPMGQGDAFILHDENRSVTWRAFAGKWWRVCNPG